MSGEVDKLIDEPSLPGVRSPKEALQYAKARKSFRAGVDGLLKAHDIPPGLDSTGLLEDRRSAAIEILMDQTLASLPRELTNLDSGSLGSVSIEINGAGPLLRNGKALKEDPEPHEWFSLGDDIVRDIAAYFKEQLVKHYGVVVEQSESKPSATGELVVRLTLTKPGS
ncbi:hypothetical protein ACFL6C_10695 [Myxococcota bacterium]